MVRNYGYENMNEFLITFKECYTAYLNYQRDVENWQKTCDNPKTEACKTESLADKLARLQKETKISQPDGNRQTKDRGAR